MTNFNHFDKPVIHFGNAGAPAPEEPPAPTVSSVLHFGSAPR